MQHPRHCWRPLSETKGNWFAKSVPSPEDGTIGGCLCCLMDYLALVLKALSVSDDGCIFCCLGEEIKGRHLDALILCCYVKVLGVLLFQSLEREFSLVFKQLS